MKMNKAIVYTALLLAVPCMLRAESAAYATGFESADGFAAGPLGESSANWVTRGGYPFAVVDGSSAGGSGQILESATGQAGEAARAWIRNVDFPSSDKVVVEMDIRAVDSGSSGYQANIQLGDFKEAPPTGARGTAAQVSLRGSGKVIVFDGESEKEIGTFFPGEWMKLRIEANNAASKFTVSINGADAAADINFRDPQVQQCTALGFTHYSSSTPVRPCSMAVDNVKISAP